MSFRRDSKKKDFLAPSQKQERNTSLSPEAQRVKLYRSSLLKEESFSSALLSPSSFTFFMPASPPTLKGLHAWEITARYHDLKQAYPQQTRRLKEVFSETILSQAQAVLGSLSRNQETKQAPLSELPWEGEKVEFNLDETLEQSLLEAVGSEKHLLLPSDVWMDYSLAKKQPLILSVDRSVSMEGEKFAFAALAIAVVLLEFEQDPLGLIAFESEAHILKRPHEKISTIQLIERFLDLPTEGFTHLEKSMKAALQLASDLQPEGRGVPVIFMTDGQYTLGKNPTYLSHAFHKLLILKMGNERSSLSLCQELTHKGHGDLYEVPEWRNLPRTLYEVIRHL